MTWEIETITISAGEEESASRKIRLEKFVYSSDISYLIEFGNQYIRFFYNDVVLTTDGEPPLSDHSTDYWIETPYLTEHLFQLQFKQVGDVIRITHPLYKQATLTRTGASTFLLQNIDFRDGPFMLRNDLIAPDNPNNITMTPSVTGLASATGQYDISSWNLTVNAAPTANDWSVGAVLTGGTSAAYCTVVQAVTSKHYIVTNLHGTFSLGETISDDAGSPNSVACSATFPQVTINEPGYNHIKDNWWDGNAAHGVDNSSSDYCGGGRKDDGRRVFITYTATLGTAVTLTDVKLSYICSSHDQTADLTLNEHTQRGLRVLANGTWQTIVQPSVIDTLGISPPGSCAFSATRYTGKTSKLIGWNNSTTITLVSPINKVTAIEVYLYAKSNEASTGCAIFNLSANTDSAFVNGTLTASSDYFVTGHEGALFKLIQERVTSVISLNIRAGVTNDTYSDEMETEGTFRIVSSGTWSGTVELQRNDNGAGWETFRTFVSDNNNNIQEAFVEDGFNVYYRIKAAQGLTGSIHVTVSLDDPLQTGIVRIVTVASSTLAYISVILPLTSATATKRWAEGAWSDYRGYPTSCTFFEERCCYLGNIGVAYTTAKLLTAWLSASGDYDSFKEGVNDADSFAVTIPSAEDPMWIESLTTLFAGTGADEWEIKSNRLDQPITYLNKTCKPHSAYGSSWIQPVKMDDSILFVDSSSRNLREITYEDKNTKEDLTILAEHITESGIVWLTVQYGLETIVWCGLDNGSVVTFTYEPVEKVKAWARQPFYMERNLYYEDLRCEYEGMWVVDMTGYCEVQSGCVLLGIEEDELFLAVKRIINGAEVFYIEKMQSREWDTLREAFYVDCGLTYDSTPTDTVTAAHLIGETVSVFADGKVQSDKLVAADGAIVLDEPASIVHYGLPYESLLKPMRLVFARARGDTSLMSDLKISRLGISFMNAVAAMESCDDINFFDIDFDNVRWTNSAEIAGLFTGEVEVTAHSTYDPLSPIEISVNTPTPCIVRAIVAKADAT